MGSRRLAGLALAIGASLAAPAAAGEPQLVVLRFTGEGFSKAVLDSATSAAEAAALRVAAGRLKIVTRDMLAAVVGEERLLRCEAEARCELDLGVGLGTGYLLAGALRKVGARAEVTVKLYDVRKLGLLAQEQEAAAGEEPLLARIDPLVQRTLRVGLSLGGQGPGTAGRPGTFGEAGTALAPAEAAGPIVAFESTPAGATVRVDGQLLCQETACRKRLSAGEHVAVFERERHAPSTVRFTATPGAIVRATLAPRFGWITVESDPPGVAVSVDGVDAGRTPLAGREVDEGTVEIAVSDACWLRSGERVAVAAGERRTVKLAPRPRMAGLRVDAEDEKGNAVEAQVSVDGKVAGAAGAVLAVPACSRKVKVPLGSATFEAPLRLEEGKTTVIATGRAGAAAAGALVCPEGMAAIPGGRDQDGEHAPFCLDVTEVTHEAYTRCFKDGRCARPSRDMSAELPPPVRAAYSEHCNERSLFRGQQPANCVAWKDAQRYCHVAGKRLPSAAEWLWALRGAGTAWPRPRKDQACWAEPGSNHGFLSSVTSGRLKGTCAVGSFPGGKTPQGVLDLVGNVQEWTSTPLRNGDYVVCDLAWDSPETRELGCFLQAPAPRKDSRLGFRCATGPDGA